MRELITVCVGGAGVRIGERLWELLCREHGIGLDGNMVPGFVAEAGDAHGTFFEVLGSGRRVPRAVFVDLEPSAVEEVRSGACRRIFHPEQLITGKEGASRSFARGRYSRGRELIDRTLDRIRRLADKCADLQGFIILHSLGGGTGSGFTSLLLERLSAEYGNKATTIQFAVSPSPTLSTSAVENYNAVLCTKSSVDYSDCCFVLDNEAVFDMLRVRLDVERPTYKELNDVMAHAISDVTASLRFSGEVNSDLRGLAENLVPYAKIHFPLISYAPMTSAEKPEESVPTVHEITASLFEPRSQFVKCDEQTGKTMSFCLLYRGDVKTKDIAASVAQIQEEGAIEFVDWCPGGFKFGVNAQRLVNFEGDQMAKAPRSVLGLSTTTAMAGFWSSLGRKFDLMYRKKAFVHGYVRDGMEEGEFTRARETLAALEKDYEAVGSGVSPQE